MAKYKYGKYIVTQIDVVDYYVENTDYYEKNIGEFDSVNGHYGYSFNRTTGRYTYSYADGSGFIRVPDEGRIYIIEDGSMAIKCRRLDARRDPEYGDYGVVYESRDYSIPVYKKADAQGTYVTTIIAENGTYPDNGKHTDGYWYVKLGLALMFNPMINNEVHSCEGGMCMIDGVLRTVDHTLTMINDSLRNS